MKASFPLEKKLRIQLASILLSLSEVTSQPKEAHMFNEQGIL